MRANLLLIVLLFYSIVAQGQNLVPNGSFESYTTCPNNQGQIAYAIGWGNVTGTTSDYYNACSSAPNWTVPSNVQGYEPAAHGNAYTGIFTYGPTTNYKEYVGRSMSSMTIGKWYKVAISVSLSDLSYYGTNDLGVYFYNNHTFPAMTPLTNFTPQVSFVSYGAITDKAGWRRLNGYMLADSAYNNIIVGGFLDDATLTKVSTSTTASSLYSYYYIDSITVHEAPPINMNDVNINICAGGKIQASYFLNKTFGPGNVFTLQLSDTFGNFTNPVNIGSVTANSGSGTINGIIPYTALPSAGYKLRIVSSNNPDSSSPADGVVAVYKYANPVMTMPSSLCVGDTLTMSAVSTAAVDTFVWYGPRFSGLAGNPVSVLGIALVDSGNYILKAVHNGCAGFDTARLNVKNLPLKPVITVNTPLCEEDTLFLKANSGTATSYDWSGPNAFASNLKDTFIHKVPLAGNGDYIVTAWLNGCKARDTATVTVKLRPHPQIMSNNPVCEKGTLMLNVTETASGELYTWAGPAGFTSNTRTNLIADAQLAKAGKYVVSVTYNGCSNKDSLSVIVKPLPVKPVASSNSPICEEDSVRLQIATMMPAVVYSWTVPAGITYPNATQLTIIPATLQGSGDYRLNADLNGCMQYDTIAVKVKPKPQRPVIMSNAPLKAGQDLVLDIQNTQAGVSYTWTGPKNFLSNSPGVVIKNIDTSATGTYFLSAVLDGCNSSSMILVQIDEALDTGKVIVYPVPTDGNFKIKGLFKQDQYVQLRITDQQGKEVYEATLPTKNNMLMADVTLKGYLASGVYNLRLQADGKRQTLRIVVR